MWLVACIQEPAAISPQRRAGVVAGQCAIAGRCGLFRRSVAVRRYPACCAERIPPQGGRQAWLYRAVVPETVRAETAEQGLKVTDVGSLASLWPTSRHAESGKFAKSGG